MLPARLALKADQVRNAKAAGEGIWPHQHRTAWQAWSPSCTMGAPAHSGGGWAPCETSTPAAVLRGRSKQKRKCAARRSAGASQAPGCARRKHLLTAREAWAPAWRGGTGVLGTARPHRNGRRGAALKGSVVLAGLGGQPCPRTYRCSTTGRPGAGNRGASCWEPARDQRVRCEQCWGSDSTARWWALPAGGRRSPWTRQEACHRCDS